MVDMTYPWKTRLIFVCTLAGLGMNSAGCDEFATPAELAKPQILAIRADPASVSPGGTTTLTILVADDSGPVVDPAVTWETTATNPGEPPLGSVASPSGEQVVFTAPSEVSDSIAVASVMARVTISGDELLAIKAVPIGDVPLSNPELVALTADGGDLLASNTLSLTRGQTVSLEVEVDNGLVGDDMTSFAWYTTSGAIERYQSNPVELVAADEPGSGSLIAVVRNGVGGVVWRILDVAVE